MYKGNRILIVQPTIAAYRIPFFLQLAESIGHISVLHFDESYSFLNEENIDEIRGTTKSIFGLKYVSGLRKWLKRFDVVIVFFDPHWPNLFLLPLFKKNLRVILWGHGFGRSNLINQLRLFVLERADAMITYDENGKNEITARKHRLSSKIFVAPNTIDVTNSQNTSYAEKNSFLYVGRLQRRKKLDVFLKIYAELALIDRKIVFNILGNGLEEEKLLKNLAKDLGISEGVNFIPGTSDPDVLLRYFKTAYSYISPGAVGLGVLHAFSYGVPVLTMEGADHGPEVSNIINGINGYLTHDEEALKKAVTKIVDNSDHIKMGSNAFHHYSEKRQLDNMIGGFLTAIDYVS